MTVDLYGTETTSVPFSQDRSFLRPLEFIYTENARSAIKKAWLRNGDPDNDAIGVLHAGSIVADSEGPDISDSFTGYAEGNFYSTYGSPFPGQWWGQGRIEDDSFKATDLGGGSFSFGTILKDQFGETTPVSSLTNGISFKFNTNGTSHSGYQYNASLGQNISGNAGVRIYEELDDYGFGMLESGSGIAFGIYVLYDGVGQRSLFYGLYDVNQPPDGYGVTELDSDTFFSGTEAEVIAILNSGSMVLTIESDGSSNIKFTSDGTTYVDSDFTYPTANIRTVALVCGEGGDTVGIDLIQSYDTVVGEPIAVAGQNTWFSFAEDVGGVPGTWGNDLIFSLGPNEHMPVWIRLTVPLTESPSQKIDLSIGAYVL